MKVIARRLLEMAAHRPHGLALVDAEPSGADPSVDYRTLDRGSNRIAGLLSARGVRPDEPVVVFTSNRVRDVVALLGAWRAGAVAVPVHRSNVAATVEHVFAATGARLAVGWDESAKAPVPASAAVDGEVLRLRQEPPAARDELRDGLLVVFTSGTTGVPKGVVLSDTAFAGKLDAIDRVLTFRDSARTLLVLQLNFSFAQWVCLLTLSKGGTVFVLRKFAAPPFLESLQRFDIDYTAVVPTMLRAAQPPLEGPASVPLAGLRERRSPRLIIAGGEPLSADLGRRYVELLPDSQLTDVFGLTETCTSDFIVPPERYPEWAGSIGRPSPNVDFRLVDPETGTVVPAGEEGELEIRTPFAMTAYLGAPDLTRSSYRDGYFRTGDLAAIDDNGCVRLAGRRKDVIIRGGNKVSPLEIDNVLVRHPGVRACLSTGVEDPDLGQRIHTLIVPQGEPPEEDRLREWLSLRLEKYKVPDRIHRALELPQGRTGKADRRALREWIEYDSALSSKRN